MSETSHWVSVWLLFFCGCTLALHIGKLPPALPLLTEAYSLRLSQAGNLVATFSVLIALSGLALGVAVARIGYVTFATLGVALAGLGSILGAMSSSFPLLMLSRAIEGLGWIVAVVAIPVLMASLAKPADKPVVLAIWGAFVPAGTGVMLLLSPWIHDVGGWRLAWWLSAAASLLASVVVLLVGRRHQARFESLKHHSFKNPLFELRSRQAWGLFLCFFFYSFQFLSLTAFLPSILVEQDGMSLASASRWTACVILANIVGNITAGRLIRRGVPPHRVLAFAAAFIGLMALIALSPFPTVVRLAAAFAFAVIGGLIPGSLFATAPQLASRPAATGILIGLMLQAAGLGQWAGPLLLTKLVEVQGLWWHGGLLLLLIGIFGAISAKFALGKLPLLVGTPSVHPKQ